jgi:hypothetical protein
MVGPVEAADELADSRVRESIVARPFLVALAERACRDREVRAGDRRTQLSQDSARQEEHQSHHQDSHSRLTRECVNRAPIGSARCGGL